MTLQPEHFDGICERALKFLPSMIQGRLKPLVLKWSVLEAEIWIVCDTFCLVGSNAPYLLQDVLESPLGERSWHIPGVPHHRELMEMKKEKEKPYKFW